MRITAEEKNATKERIVAAAVELFRARGFEATTTRDIARQAKIASGTITRVKSQVPTLVQITRPE